MTITDIQNRITFLTGLDTNIYLPADRLNAINNAYDKLHSIILESQDEWDFDDSNAVDLPISETELTSGVNTYVLPDTLYKVNKVEVNYGSGMVKAIPLDLNETGLSEDEVSARANVSSPRYRLFSNTLKFYPTPTETVALGIQVYYDREVESFTADDITTGTKKPGFDRLFHDYIALQASLDAGVGFNLNNSGDISNLLQEMEARIRKYYGSKTLDRKFKITNLVENYE